MSKPTSAQAAEARRQRAEYDFLLDALVARLHREAEAEADLMQHGIAFTRTTLSDDHSLTTAPIRAALVLHRSRS